MVVADRQREVIERGQRVAVLGFKAAQAGCLYSADRVVFVTGAPHSLQNLEFGGSNVDYVDGVDGARLLADRYPAGMPVEEVVRIVTAVGAALD